MVTLIRGAQVAVLLVLAVIALQLSMTTLRPETGGVEKLVLAGLLATCFVVGVGVTSAATRLQLQFAESR